MNRDFLLWLIFYLNSFWTHCIFNKLTDLFFQAMMANGFSVFKFFDTEVPFSSSNILKNKGSLFQKVEKLKLNPVIFSEDFIKNNCWQSKIEDQKFVPQARRQIVNHTPNSINFKSSWNYKIMKKFDENAPQ